MPTSDGLAQLSKAITLAPPAITVRLGVNQLGEGAERIDQLHDERNPRLNPRLGQKIQQLRLAQLDESRARPLLNLLRDPAEQTALRAQALRTLRDLPGETWIGAASDVLHPTSNAAPSLQLETVRALSNELMFGRAEHHRQHAIEKRVSELLKQQEFASQPVTQELWRCAVRIF